MAKPLKFNAEPIIPKIEPVKPTTGYQSTGIQKSEIPDKPLPAGQQYVLQSDGSYKSFATPTGVSPAPQPEPVFDGGIKYKATGTKGVYTNAQGQYVNASGKLVDAPEPDTISGVVKQTYAEQAESQMRGQFKTDYENALKYGITLPYKTFEEYKDYIQGGKQDNLSYLQKQQDLARGVEDMQTQTALEGIEAAKKGVTATMAQGREGAVTTSKPQFTTEFAGQMQRQVDQIKLEKASAEAQRQQAVTELKRAQEAGDVELAQSIQGQLSAIDSNLRQIDTQALQASTLANQQALDLAKFESDKSIAEQASARANLTTFTGLVDMGVELSTEGVMQFAQSLNVPFEAAYGYYQGSQSVRDDKTLTQEEKQIKNAQLAQNLQDTITGQNIAEVKKLALIEEMYKAGASKEEISRAKDAFGLTDKDDPVYQADLRIKLADAAIKEMQANGEVPYGSKEWIDRQAAAYDLAAQQQDYYDQYGGDWDTEVFKIGQAVGWCGEYASTLSTAGKVGDMWSEKRQRIEDKNPTIGDKLLIPLGGADGYGHVAVVLGYDPVTGDVQVAESNVDGRQNKGAGLGVATFGNYNVFELNQKFGDDWGVSHGDLKPEYAQAFNPGGGSGLTQRLTTQITLLGKSKDQRAQIQEDIPFFIKNGDQQGLKNYVTKLAINELPAERRNAIELRSNIVGRMEYMNQLMSEYDGDLGIFQGTKTKVLNKINELPDPKQQEIAQLILINLEDYGRAQTGAAIQDFENTKFEKILPNIYDGKELSNAKFNAFAKTLELDVENTIKRAIGDELYTTVYEKKGLNQAAEDDFVEGLDLDDMLLDQFLNQL